MRVYEIMWFDYYAQGNKVSLVKAYSKSHAYNILHQYYPKADVESISEYREPVILTDKREEYNGH